MPRFIKAYRLRTKADYEQVFAQSKKVVTSEFTVLYRKNRLDHARLGLIISKKAIPKAHDRNRIKRIIRESFRNNQVPEMDVIFMAKKGSILVENSVLFANLNKIWNKLTII